MEKPKRSYLLDAAALQDHFSRSIKLDLQIRKANRLRSNAITKRKSQQNSKPEELPVDSNGWRLGWTCEMCTLLNKPSYKRCRACFARRVELDTRDSLAQRRGLKPSESPTLTPEKWLTIEQASVRRKDSFAPCPICCQPFRMKDQVILSCSHVFHKACIQSFERFVRLADRCCPICRHKPYEKRDCSEGKRAFRASSIVKLQSWHRGLQERRKLKKRLGRYYASGRGDSVKRRSFYVRRLHGVTHKIMQRIQKKEDSIDRLFAQLDVSVQNSRQILQATSRPLGNNQWEEIRSRALGRDHLECPICMVDIQKVTTKTIDVSVLKCSHVFHKHCLLAFERFKPESLDACPVCRATYTTADKADLFLH